MSTFTINSNIQNISFNGYDVQKLMFNGNLVWEKDNTSQYISKYLTIKVLSSGVSLKWKCNNTSYAYKIYYRKNGGSWTQITPTTSGTSISVSQGNIIEFRGDNNTYTPNGSSSYTNKFDITGGSVEVYGNIMSLIYGQLFDDKTTFPDNSSLNFYSLFQNCTSITNIENLILPATTLTASCYSSMFGGCSNLIKGIKNLNATTLAPSCCSQMFKSCSSLINAPKLPATIAVEGCYYYMFEYCTSLITVPSLPATTVNNQCYMGMFSNCSSLINIPSILPATTLARECYKYMFSSCTSLINAPELPATTLAIYCYGSMFINCTSLRYLKAMFTTTPSNVYTETWVSGCSNTSDFIFVKNSAATWTTTGNNAVLSNWTIQRASS